MTNPTTLQDARIPVQIKLAALWTSTMFCYLYADYFGLYVPGALHKTLDGIIEPLGPTTQNVLLGTSLMMAIPSVMIFLSVALKPAANFGTMKRLMPMSRAISPIWQAVAPPPLTT